MSTPAARGAIVGSSVAALVIAGPLGALIAAVAATVLWYWGRPGRLTVAAIATALVAVAAVATAVEGDFAGIGDFADARPVASLTARLAGVLSVVFVVTGAVRERRVDEGSDSPTEDQHAVPGRDLA
ncbi:MAG: hypothetical protein OEU32_11295 [Acidimicrobiia bacterium]|nr:hypothetical protein [Acidimicrobiia bacterium]